MFPFLRLFRFWFIWGPVCWPQPGNDLPWGNSYFGTLIIVTVRSGVKLLTLWDFVVVLIQWITLFLVEKALWRKSAEN